MRIYLLGVTHDQQTTPSSEFVAYIEATYSLYGIRSFAEEMSIDGLSDVGARESILKHIADVMDVPHNYCGITRAERTQRGILGLQDIQIHSLHYDWSQSRIKEEEKRYFSMIEYAWLEKLSPAFVDPMLFVCGAAHLDSFANKATESGFTAIPLKRKFITSDDEFIRKRSKKANSSNAKRRAAE